MENNDSEQGSKKLYRVDWKFIDLDKGVDEDYAYIGAVSPEDAIYGIEGTDFKVREATKEEIEAYVAGYEDGYDIALINERFRDMDLDKEEMFDLDKLQEVINQMESDLEEDDK